MTRREPEKPERPKLRVLFPERGPKWLIMDPARLAPVGGIFFATLAMIYFLLLQALGRPLPPMDVILGLLKTFVVSYAGTGLFVYFVMHVRENEFPVEHDPRQQLGIDDGEEDNDENQPALPVPSLNDEEPEQDEEIS